MRIAMSLGIALCLLLCVPCLMLAQTTAQPAEIHWNELATLIAGQQVTIPLPGGGAVAGEVLSVRDDSLMLDVSRTSDPTRYPKGQTAIPRAGLAQIRLIEHRSNGGRVLGSVVGALLGIVAGAEIAVHGADSDAAGVATFSAVAVGVTVGGYFAGRTLDRRTRTLRVASDR